MIEDMQIRNLALNTQETYVEQVERFARHFRRLPERLGPPEVRFVRRAAERKTLFVMCRSRPHRCCRRQCLLWGV